jgi:hypothetical protein
MSISLKAKLVKENSKFRTHEIVSHEYRRKLLFNIFFFDLPVLDSDNVIYYFTDDFLIILPAKDDRDVKFTDYVFENYNIDTYYNILYPWTPCFP